MTLKSLDNLDALYKAKCPICEKDFESNHLNRRYCSDRCRIRNNNFNAKIERLANKPTTRILEKNFKILNEYKDDSIVSTQVLLNKGYRLDFQTTRMKNEKGVDYSVCYNSGIAFVDNNKTKVLIKHFKYEEVVKFCR